MCVAGEANAQGLPRPWYKELDQEHHTAGKETQRDHSDPTVDGQLHLSDRHLAALTVIHDYHLRRSDGTTAAERFFGSPHDELFEWLLDHLDVPARPRSRQLARVA